MSTHKAPTTIATTAVYCSGYDTNGEWRAITNPRQSNLCHIHNGNGYALFTDANHQNIWACGDNTEGQCGLGGSEHIKSLRPLRYFQLNNIEIKKICTNISRKTTFFIGRNYRVYGNGRNTAGQLGLDDCNCKYQPYAIEFLQDKYITDVQLVGDYALALHDRCKEATLIMQHWATSSIDIPADVVKLILLFTPIVNKVYSTQYRHAVHKHGESRWSEIDNFRDDSIIKIRAGRFHCIFQQSNGMLWCSGGNHYGQLGVIVTRSDTRSLTAAIEKYAEDPVRLDMFARNEILIKEIKCGAFHNLAIDYFGNVWSWGKNDSAQCGDVGADENKLTPQKILSLQKYKVVDIDCGSFHSYCKTQDGMHFLFGNNEHNECCTFDGRKFVTKPFCINEVIEEKTNGKKIVRVALSYCNTRIIVAGAGSTVRFECVSTATSIQTALEIPEEKLKATSPTQLFIVTPPKASRGNRRRRRRRNNKNSRE